MRTIDTVYVGLNRWRVIGRDHDRTASIIIGWAERKKSGPLMFTPHPEFEGEISQRITRSTKTLVRDLEKELS